MGVLLGLLAGVTYGAADFIGGLASRRSSTLAVVAISQLAGLIVLMVLLPLLPSAAPTALDLGWGALAGVSGAAGITFLYRGLAIGRMSVVSPVTAVIGALIPVVVGLLLGERPTVFALCGVGLALLSVLLVSSAEMPGEPASNAAPGLVGQRTAQAGGAAVRMWFAQAGLVEAILSGIGVGGFLVFLARTHANAGLWPLACSRVASVSIIVALALLVRRSLAPARGSWTMISSAGILDMTANAFYLLATRHGMLAIVAVLGSLYPASTVLLARTILHERLTRLQIAGVGSALVAVALIAVGTQP